MEQTTVLKLIVRERVPDCETTSSLIVIWRLARAPLMLSARNFNPFVVETISPRNARKPCEINELKLDLRGEGEDQTTMRTVTVKESRPWEHLIFNDS